MSERRFSFWHVLLAIGIAWFICAGSFAAGAAFGFLWGKDHGVASVLRERPWQAPLEQAPVEPWPILPEEPFLPPEAPAPAGRPYLGVVYQTVTPEFAEQHDLDVDYGAFISEVIEGSPAQRGGLRVGDVILEVDGERVTTRNTLTDLVATYSPGDTVELTVLRRGKPSDFVITFGEGPRQQP
jgi:membrane-associated protease RseP (regulator of RpoE activity)